MNRTIIVPADLTEFYAIEAFIALDELDWTLGGCKAEVGDEVYFYASKPYQKIIIKGIVIKIDIPLSECIDDSKYLVNPEDNKSISKATKNGYKRVRLIEIYSDEVSSNLSYSKLLQNGLKGSVRGPLILENNKQLYDYITKVEQENNAYCIDEGKNYNYQEKIQSASIIHTPNREKKIKVKLTNGWARDARVAKEALIRANFTCEIDNKHETFISKYIDEAYMEAHHLIPMNAQDRFEYSLDVPGNIVSLCPNCHRKIHFGKIEDKIDILQQLYNAKRGRLDKFNINISLEELLNIYR